MKYKIGDKVVRKGMFEKKPLKITNTHNKKEPLYFCEYGRKGNGCWLTETEIRS